jgi:pimeloyl-ACP methyl ester carboxylesterase
MSAIILNQKIVHYEVLGRGRPVLFLHGWVGSWRYWIPSMQAVSTNYRAYALDFWGFGGSAKDPSRYLISEQSHLITSFMNELGMGKIALIGHGLGAVVGLNLATQFPNLVDRMMAISMPLEAGMLNPRLSHSTPEELADWLLGSAPETQAARVEAPKTDQDAILRTINNLSSLDLNKLSTHLTTPCLLVNGLNDPAVTCPSTEKVSGLPEHLHHITFDQSGHFPMLDQPSKFNRLMFDFLILETEVSLRELQIKQEWKRRLR